MMYIQRLLSASFLLLVLVGSAVAAETSVPPPLLQLGPGDQVKIDVFGNPDLATTTSVTDDGSIHMPLAGAVAVGGQSPAEAARRIEAALKAGQFLVNPQVTVNLVQSVSQRVSVLGEVKNPGSYPIQSSSTIFDLVALAGGLTDKGSDVVYILRPDASGVLQRLPVDMRRLGSPNASSTAIKSLRGGDTIVVPKGTFFVTGQVVKPGEYLIEGEMMLFEAIARAGGVTALGSTSRVEVRRRGPDDQAIEVKSNKNLRIQPGDVINVKERLF
jgi:polysaccharide export outer membrane protein